ncbi:hypothetical protein E3N88_07092 [Mikania micrantha]|uniref:Uncharacterized protein n=1 Tax=Mikania micrantha TaxID=192012 RepID=A0A5N6PRX8_9ASTR|nr:hypothetical protein E3N88_07092 [Mikania micrantha]
MDFLQILKLESIFMCCISVALQDRLYWHQISIAYIQENLLSQSVIAGTIVASPTRHVDKPLILGNGVDGYYNESPATKTISDRDAIAHRTIINTAFTAVSKDGCNTTYTNTEHRMTSDALPYIHHIRNVATLLWKQSNLLEAEALKITEELKSQVKKIEDWIQEAVISLLEKVKTVKEDIKELRKEIQKGKTPALENEQLLEELNKKLEKVSISGEKLHKPKEEMNTRGERLSFSENQRTEVRANQEDQIREYRRTQRLRNQIQRWIPVNSSRRYNRTIESQIDPEAELRISQTQRASLVPAEVLYDAGSRSVRHRVYQHYSEERILVTMEGEQWMLKPSTKMKVTNRPRTVTTSQRLDGSLAVRFSNYKREDASTSRVTSEDVNSDDEEIFVRNETVAVGILGKFIDFNLLKSLHFMEPKLPVDIREMIYNKVDTQERDPLNEAALNEWDEAELAEKQNNLGKRKPKKKGNWGTLGQFSGKYDYWVDYSFKKTNSLQEEVVATGWDDDVLNDYQINNNSDSNSEKEILEDSDDDDELWWCQSNGNGERKESEQEAEMPYPTQITRERNETVIEEWAFALIQEEETLDEEVYVTTISSPSWRPEVKLAEEQESSYYDEIIESIPKPTAANQTELINELMKRCLELQKEVDRMKEIIQDNTKIILERERLKVELERKEDEEMDTEVIFKEQHETIAVSQSLGIQQKERRNKLYNVEIYFQILGDYNYSVTKKKALEQLLARTLSSVINHSVYTVFSTWLPKDYHQYQKNQWKSEDQQRYMMKCEDSCSISMKKSLDTCISLEQCSVLGESTMKPEQEEIMQEVNGEVMGSGPPITWMKQYENGKLKELVLPISKDRRPKQRWAFRATGYGGPLLKVQYSASVLEDDRAYLISEIP